MASADLINAADANQEILDGIQKVEGDEAEFFKQVLDSFDSLGKLISQVTEAFKASKNREKETNVTDMITDRIKKEIEETIKRKVEAQREKEEEFQREIEEAERNLSEKMKYLDDKSKSKLRIWSAFLGIFQSKEESVERARQMLEEAEKRMKKNKEEAKDSDKMFNEDIQRWQDKRVELDKTLLDQIAKPPTLENNIRVLALLRDKCLGMDHYFNQIRNNAYDVTFPRLTDFSAQVENGEGNAIPIEDLEKSLQLMLESCAKTHHSAEMYVKCKKHLREDEASTDVRKAAEVNKPFGQRAKKSFPQPKRFKVPQPVLGKDPNHPEIEVVEYVEKVKPILEPHQVSNYTTSPISSEELNLDFSQHSIKKEIITADQISGGEEPQQTPSIKASPVPESEQNNESPVYTPDQSVFNHPCPAHSPDKVVEIKTSPLHTSYRETSPALQPCTAGPSGEKILSDEETNRTVTSTTSLFTGVGGGSPMDEEYKRSLLASMKQAYTSELNQSEKKQGSESDASLNDSATMPQLFKSPNSGYETDKSRPPPDLHFEDSFDEELDSLAKKTLFGSSDSKTDFGLDSQEEVQSTKELTTTSTAVAIDLSHLTSLDKPASTKPIPDLQEIHHPPTPALTPLNPLTDELEAAMAKLHGESLNEEPEEDKMPPLSMTNIIVTKIVKEHSVSSRTESVKVNASTTLSDSEYQPDSDEQEARDKFEARKPSLKPYKYHKIGPKSKMGPLSVHKPLKLNTVEGGTEINETNFEVKSKSKSTATPRALSRHSREVEKLCEDEMVQNMLRDIEERGLNKRRMSAITYKEFTSNGSDKEVRGSRRGKRSKKDDSFDFELTPPKKKKMSRTTSTPVVESSPQDQALQQWEPLLNSTNEDKVVYVPRKLANPADSSVIVRRRTFSSDSSADGNQNNKRKILHSLEGVQRSLFTLNDHSYTSVKSSHELGSAQHSTDDLVSKLSAKCQEIHISCRDHLLCVKLCPRTSILRNSLNSNILRELSMVLRKLKMETSIHVVLITSSGPDFCNGIDFPSLIHDNMAQRLESAMTVVSNLQEFITELANCDKMLIGGLVGSVMGLGVAMLPYLNAVYACDKTSFCLPYVKLGQSYEGGLSLTLSSMCRNLDNLLFCEGRRLTATQAKDCGLIQDVFLPDNFEKEVVLRACKMAAEFTQSSLAGKRMSHAALRRDLPDVLKEESQLLRQTWISDDFQRRAKQLYANGDLLLSL